MEKLKKLMDSRLKLERDQSWPIGNDTKWFIYRNVKETTRSIETGIGYSTLIFAERGANHTVCFPFVNSKERIIHYAEKAEISLEKVNFVIGPSQYTLPKLNKRLNFALIDGDHMFPSPMIDFYYINNILDTKGLLIIDDLHIPSVRILYDFLIISKKWKLIEILDSERACAFLKTSHDDYEWFGVQEYNQLTKLGPLKRKYNKMFL